MGWSVGSESGRDIGYGVPAQCDHPKCSEEIDRGMSYRCGDGSHGEVGCGLFFCEKHRRRWKRGYACCSRCADGRQPYEAKPDVAEWVQHKLTDPSWSQWRAKNPQWVARNKTPNSN
jgi:hypothetical protein